MQRGSVHNKSHSSSASFLQHATMEMEKSRFSSLFLPILSLFSVLAVAGAADSDSDGLQLRPHALDSFNLTYIQNLGSCSYKVVIKTSCSSVVYTRDQISIAFGDAYGNQVYGPRIDDPASKAFERCSSDTYQITGPCTYQLCYVYLYRSGIDGWMPESVQIYSSTSKAVSFFYNTFIPNEVWYGFNLCNSPPSSSGNRIFTNIIHGLLLSALLFFCM